MSSGSVKSAMDFGPLNWMNMANPYWALSIGVGKKAGWITTKKLIAVMTVMGYAFRPIGKLGRVGTPFSGPKVVTWLMEKHGFLLALKPEF